MISKVSNTCNSKINFGATPKIEIPQDIINKIKADNLLDYSKSILNLIQQTKDSAAFIGKKEDVLKLSDSAFGSFDLSFIEKGKEAIKKTIPVRPGKFDFFDALGRILKEYIEKNSKNSVAISDNLESNIQAINKAREI